MNKVCVTCNTELKMPFQKIYCSKKCKSKNHYGSMYKCQQNRGLMRKIYFIRLLGGKCNSCGYNKNISVLEFHHINGKEFELDMRTLSNLSFDRLEKEVKKCKVLCANCHRESHNEIERFKLSKYDNLNTENLLNHIKVNIKEKKYCKDCNKQIWNKSTTNLCNECIKHMPRPNTRKVVRPSKETLEEEIKTTSFVKLGKKYGVTNVAVRKWCKSYGINYKK